MADEDSEGVPYVLTGFDLEAVEQRVAEACAAHRERRILALAKLRFQEEQERMLKATYGRVLPEWNPRTQERYEDKARFEIELAEKIMADADAALAAFPDTRVSGEIRPAPGVAILPDRQQQANLARSRAMMGNQNARKKESHD